MAIAAKQNQTTLYEAEEAAKNSAARLSVMVAAFLIALKTATGFLTGSISVWASLLDSVMDILASTVNLFAVRAAARPADEDHAYGHGKAESLAGLFQAIVIFASGLFLIWEVIHRIIEIHQTRSEGLGAVSMLIATGVSVWLVVRLRRVARETDSLAIKSDAAHYVSDIFTNLGALIALLITALTRWRLIDPLTSTFIAVYIFWSAIKVGRESIDVLMDRRLPLDVDERIADIVSRFKDQGVVGFHDLRTRRSGAQKFIDLHLEVQRDQRLQEAHDLTVRVLRTIEAEVPRARVHIHTDPVE